MTASVTTAHESVDIDSVDLNDKQRRILAHLRSNPEQTYFKSRLVGEAVDLSAKEVGANIKPLDDVPGITIEKWGYSGATTWKVTQ